MIIHVFYAGHRLSDHPKLQSLHIQRGAKEIVPADRWLHVPQLLRCFHVHRGEREIGLTFFPTINFEHMD